jgi:MFS family permease
MENNNKDKHAYSHFIAASCFGIQAIGVGTYTTFGIFFSPLMSEFGWSRAVISGAASAAFLLMGFLGIYVGRLNDTIGPRKLMTVTGLFLGMGLFLMSRLTEIWQLYVFYGIIVGIGLSSIDVIALSTIARWFEKKRGFMTGIVKLGTGSGQFLFPLLAGFLIVGYGWRTAYVIMAFAVGLILVLLAQVLRRDPGQKEMDVDVGIRPPGGETTRAVPGFTLHEAIQTRQLWTICATMLAVVFSFLVIVVHIVPHVKDLGISTASAAGILSTIGGVSMAGRFVIGIIIDRIGSKKAMSIGIVLLVAALLWLQVADELWMLYLFAAICGLAHGSFFTTISPFIAEFFGLKSHGVLFGIVAFSGTVGGAVGPIFAGYIYDRTSSYDPAFWICTLMGVLGLAVILTLKPIEGESD